MSNIFQKIGTTLPYTAVNLSSQIKGTGYYILYFNPTTSTTSTDSIIFNKNISTINVVVVGDERGGDSSGTGTNRGTVGSISDATSPTISYTRDSVGNSSLNANGSGGSESTWYNYYGATGLALSNRNYLIEIGGGGGGASSDSVGLNYRGGSAGMEIEKVQEAVLQLVIQMVVQHQHL